MTKQTHHNDIYTVTSGSEKKRVRLRLGQSQSEVMQTPYLLGIQIDSYELFLQAKSGVKLPLGVWGRLTK